MKFSHDEQRAIFVLKANWSEFLKWCKKEGLSFNTSDELGDAVDAYLAEALRVRTKYDN